MTYAEALAAAAVLVAATKAKPAPLESLSASMLTAARSTQRATAAASTAIRLLWKSTNPYDDRAVDEFAAGAGRVMVPTQRAVASVTAAARTQQLRAAGVQVTVTPKVPDDVRSAAPDGSIERRGRVSLRYGNGTEPTVTQRSSDTSRVFARVAENFRYTYSQNNDQAAANAAAERRIDSLIDGNLQVVRSRVEFQSMEQAQAVDLDRPIIGYRRIIHPEMSRGGVCGMCVIAADRIYKIGELKAIHARCWCTVLEVFEDYDPGHQMNGDDLKKLYDAAGGNTRNLLKRTRYKIVEHSELGPILTPVKGSPVPYFPAPADTAALVPA
jgi:hypothetical protein